MLQDIFHKLLLKNQKIIKMLEMFVDFVLNLMLQNNVLVSHVLRDFMVIVFG
jgi:hypothetical protein